MAFYEGISQRNGVRAPIVCIRRQLNASGQAEKPNQLHYHDYTELLFGLTGFAHVYIGTARYTLPPGGMMLIDAGQTHDVVSDGSASIYIVVKFLPRVLLSGEQSLSDHSYLLPLLETAVKKPFYFPPEILKTTTLPALFDHLMQEWEEQAFGYELSLRADVTQIYLYILRCWQQNNAVLLEHIHTKGQTKLIQQAIDFVQKHYTDCDERETAAICGVSPAYFSRIFKNAMKMPFSAFLCETRLREAERLLLMTDDTVTEIAAAIGFSTTSYFISRFRKTRKMTPAQYRRQLKKLP